MIPVVWSDRRAAIVASGAVAWLAAIELGTSRSASRRPEPGDIEVDDRTGRWFDAASLVATAGAVVASRRAQAWTIPARRTTFVAGVAVLLGSIALSVVARRHLGRFHRQVLTRHADHRLVTAGPYAVVRHPLYTATVGVFVGVGAVLGNWLSLALAALPTAALLHRIGVEERMLRDEFGAAYAEYAGRTGRLLPTIRPGRSGRGRGR